MSYSKRPGTSITIFLLTLCCIYINVTQGQAADIPIVVSGVPQATIQIGANASTQEKFAASEIQTFIEKFTSAKLQLLTNQQATTTRTVIILGTLTSNPTVRSLQNGGRIRLT